MYEELQRDYEKPLKERQAMREERNRDGENSCDKINIAKWVGQWLIFR